MTSWLSPPCRWRRDWGADAPRVQFRTHVDANPVPGRMSPRPRIRHRDPRNQNTSEGAYGARHRLNVDVRSHDNRMRGRSRFHRGGRRANSWRDERATVFSQLRSGRADIGVAFLVIREVNAREGSRRCAPTIGRELSYCQPVWPYRNSVSGPMGASHACVLSF